MTNNKTFELCVKLEEIMQTNCDYGLKLKTKYKMKTSQKEMLRILYLFVCL